MNSDRWAAVERIFHAALDHEFDARHLYVHEACGSDLELRAQVESMLDADPDAESFMRRAVQHGIASIEWEKSFPGNERFQVQRRLGAGGFGVVYEVYDRHRDAVLALKMLSYVSAGALSDFKREFRSLADITHPNLITLYELIAEGNEWFFTMECVDGVNFLEHVHAGGNGAAGHDRLRNAMCQLAEGVSYLHKIGKLHCDLKPQNVLVDRDGRVVVLDFGLVRESGSAGGGRDRLAGTPDYLSPEQAAGLSASTASDWYSIGVMLYQALTNRLPYTGDVRSILRAKQIADAPEAAAIAPSAPKYLLDLCRDLLSRDPAMRPGGPEVLERLGAGTSRIGTPPPSSTTTTFIGRERELAVLRQEVDRLASGGPAAVFIHGAAGVGKTSLVGHVLDEIRSRENLTLLEGRCHEQEFVPYKALDPLVDSLNGLLTARAPEELKALLPAEMMALCRIFPVLRESASLAGVDTRAADIPEIKELRLRALGALRDLIGNLAAVKPIVIFIDDLQWGDLDSAPLLADILRPEHALPLLFIGSFRDGEKETSAFLKALLAVAPSKPGVRIVDVGLEELAPEAARDLAVSLLDRRQSAGDAELIARESGGNPFYVVELVNYMAAAGQSAQDALHATLEELVRLRLSRLPPQARRLFETITVAGQPVEVGIATAAAALTGAGYAEVSRLRLERLIRTRSNGTIEQLEPYHDRLREVSNSSLTTGSLRQHHHRLAIAWEASGRAEVRTLATHFYHAEVPEKAFGYAVEAGQQAAVALAFDSAAHFYRMALRVEPVDDPDKLSLRIRLGDSLAADGRSAESAEAYIVASDAAVGLQKLELKRHAATQFMFSGHIEQGIDLTRDVLAPIGMKIASSPWQALCSLFVTRAWIRIRGLNFRERTEDQISAWDLFRIDTCAAVWRGMTMVDSIRAHPFQAKGVVFALRAGEPGRVAKALVAEAAYYAIGGLRYRRKVEGLLQEAQFLALKSGNNHSIALVALAHGMSAFVRGEWKRAVDNMARAEALLRGSCTGVAWEIATAHMMGSVALFMRGHVAELGRRLPRILKEAEARGDLFEVTDLRTRLSHALCLVADDPARAHEEVDAALKEWGRDQFDLQHWWAFIGRIEIDLYAGRALEAWARITTEWPRLRWSFLMRVEYVHIASLQHRARVALALAAAELRDSKRHRVLLGAAQKNVNQILRHGAPWGDALAALLQAGLAAGRGNNQESLKLLHSGELKCRAAHMDLYAAAAKRLQGELAGGPGGQSMIADADRWMANEGIRSPEKMAAMLVPGFSSAVSGAQG